MVTNRLINWGGGNGGEVSTSLAFRMSMPGFFIFRFRYACLPEAGGMFTRAVGMSNVGGLYACPPKISLLNVGGRNAFWRLGGGMNSYLVRIYRRGENNPRLLVGVVEEPGVKDKKAFHTLYELWDILNLPQKRKRSDSGDGRGQRVPKK